MSIVEQLYFTFVSFRVQMGNCLRAELNEPLPLLICLEKGLDDKIGETMKKGRDPETRIKALELVACRSRVQKRIQLRLRMAGTRGK